jgi:hypothetical protein
MILKKATHKAIKYACLNFHYAKTVPFMRIGFSVFNKKNEWCGVITYGGGAGPLGAPYGLNNGQYLELTRMALNGKQESTSKAMSISIKLIKKYAPTVQMLISYADKAQGHLGIIYQATNWVYVDNIKSSGEEYFYQGKWLHARSASNLDIRIKNKLEKRKKSGKFKYLYPLNTKMIEHCKSIRLDYPKNAAEV